MTNKLPEMSFLDHLEALRWHLIRSFSVIVLLAIVAFCNKSFIFDHIILYPKSADFITYKLLCKLSEALCINTIPYKLININMAGQFTSHMIISLIAGLIISTPYVFWELWRFIKPALHDKEIKHAGGIIFYSSFLFISGILFGYFLIAPLTLNFLGAYQVSAEVANQISLNSYITTITSLTIACGITFELPMLTFFLTKIGILTPEFMRRYRRHSIVVILIVAAIITPPDVFSQVLVSIPLLFLYEISIYVSAVVLKKSNKQ